MVSCLRLKWRIRNESWLVSYVYSSLFDCDQRNGNSRSSGRRVRRPPRISTGLFTAFMAFLSSSQNVGLRHSPSSPPSLRKTDQKTSGVRCCYWKTMERRMLGFFEAMDDTTMESRGLVGITNHSKSLWHGFFDLYPRGPWHGANGTSVLHESPLMRRMKVQVQDSILVVTSNCVWILQYS